MRAFVDLANMEFACGGTKCHVLYAEQINRLESVEETLIFHSKDPNASWKDRRISWLSQAPSHLRWVDSDFVRKTLRSEDIIVSSWLEDRFYQNWSNHRYADHGNILRDSLCPYEKLPPRIMKTVCVNDEIKHLYKNRLYPHQRLIDLPNWIDERVFSMDPEVPKTRRVTAVTDGLLHRTDFTEIARICGQFGWSFELLKGYKEKEFAYRLKESEVFLQLYGTVSNRSEYRGEAFPLPGAEAMCCGAVVIGYDSFGNRYYMDNENSLICPNDDFECLRMNLMRLLENEMLRKKLFKHQQATVAGKLRWNEAREKALREFIAPEERKIKRRHLLQGICADIQYRIARRLGAKRTVS